MPHADVASLPAGLEARWRRTVWTLATLAVSSPLLISLGASMWKTPFPVNETIAILEDVRLGASSYAYFDPRARWWYRPLYFLTWDWLWRGTGSLDGVVMWFRVIEVSAVLALSTLFIWYVRPRSFLEGAAAWCALAVLIATPGLRDNLEIPMLMTLVAMPIVLVIWMLLTRETRAWHGPVIVLLTIVAIGYKEQGLVIAPLVVIAWWTRAPGAGSRLTAAVVAVAVAYLGFRFSFSQHWPVFEQSIGFGFKTLEPSDAISRFGAFPYGMYFYTAMSTVGNVLFSEPTSGLFFITRDVVYGQVQPWEIVYVVGSVMLTATIIWWAWRVIPGPGRDGWTAEARVALAFVISLLASGALSYLYSRDRLGGMAAPFYALSAYFAMCHLAERAWRNDRLPSSRLAFTTVVLAVIALAWHVRAVGTLEWTRRMSDANYVRWLAQVHERRLQFAERPVYLDIMNYMLAQGTAADSVRPSSYPDVIQRTLGPPVSQ